VIRRPQIASQMLQTPIFSVVVTGTMLPPPAGRGSGVSWSR
jgi:hypothetical protein